MKNISLEEILDKTIDSVYANVPKEHKTDFQKKIKDGLQYQTCISAMMNACEQLLELAAENALVESIFDDNGEVSGVSESIYKPHPYNKRLDEDIHVNKQSILGTIKQVK